MSEFTKFNRFDKFEFVYLLNISPPEWLPKFKLLSDHDFIIVENGEIEVLCDEVIYTLKKNDYILAHPGQTVCIIKKESTDTSAWILHFTADKYDILKNFIETDNSVILPDKYNCDGNNVLEYINLLYNEVNYKRHGYRKVLNELIEHILFECQRSYYIDKKYEYISINSEVRNTYYTAVIDYLHKYYSKKIMSSYIEKHVGLCYDYINGIIKMITGKTIMQCLYTIRMSVATELLSTTDFSITEIAEMCGFENNHYFSSRFKKYQGIQPSEYRKQIISKK
ncbi:MAG: helix-turn-helix domain-containing protein [Eubacteriales bacterium]